MQSMRILAVAFIAISGLGAGWLASPAFANDSLVSTWTLVAVEKHPDSDGAERARLPRGLLVLDRAGYVFEYFSAETTGVDEGLTGPARTLAETGGFWGRYAVDDAAGRIRYDSWDGVSPAVRGLSFVRGFELDGDRLVITSTDEPQAQGETRWTWQRVPTVEHLSPAYREVVGFWQHVEEGQMNLETRELANPRQRGPSVIVYTPGGFVGVHFPPVTRESFTGETPTAEEAQAALRGYIGYFGTLNVYPGEVSHNILSGISPGTGSILRRYADIDGDELVVELQSAGGRAGSDGDRPRQPTIVRLKRLSGADDMLP